jgi:hypothetical protein
MTTIASSSVQIAVGQIVARILDRARLPAEGGADTAPATEPATPGSETRGRAAGQPGRAAASNAGRPGPDKTSGNDAPDAGAAPNPNGSSNSGPRPATPADSASVILSALLSLANRALPMDINLNQLLNTATLKSPLAQLPAELLGKPQVIEAVVLRNTLLPSAPNGQQQPANPLLAAAANETALPPRYQVSMQLLGRVLQFISPQPLPAGQTVQLQINNRGEVLLLPAELPGAVAGKGAPAPLQPSITGAPAAAGSQPGAAILGAMTRAAPQAAALATTAPQIAGAMQQMPAALAKTLQPQQTLQQSLREVLPRQEPLHTLVPLLQKLLAPATAAALPAPIAKQLVQLLQSLPRPEQLQTGAGVKRALENSGSFLEARIARSSAPANTAAPNTESVGKVLASDLKAQMTALLDTVRRLLPDSVAVAQASEGDAETALADELVYNPKQLQRGNPAAAQRDDTIDAGDLQLAQLSKLLQSGLARIQLNQLDGAVSRHTGADPQLQVPAWVLELPLANTRGHSDNLQLRIEQRQQPHESRTRVQWNVQIAFDLHELGKIAATLAIVDKNVSATVWAEHAKTHRSVQDKIDYLRAGLESVGVRVTEMQCRLGLPPARAALISQQLVDVHT